jgi:arylsulfatase
LVYCYNCVGERYYIRSTKEVPTGEKAKLRFEFEKTGQQKFGAGGIGRLYIYNDKVGEGEIPRTVKFIYSADESFDIGRDTGSPVTDEYKAGSQFTGTIKRVVVDLVGERHVDLEAETRVAMKRQ